MNEYEFSQPESKKISSWATQMRWFGMVNVLLGLVILTVTLPTMEPYSIGFFARLVNGITSIVLGIVLLRPTDNLRRIVKTEGGDIAELMTGLRELLGGFKLVVVLTVFYIIVLVVETIAIMLGA